MKPSLIRFFTNDALEHPDNYTPAEIVNHWTDDDLESIHNWVQWCFPLREASKYQPDCPTLDDRTIQGLRSSTVCQANLDALMWRTIDFYDRTTHWLKPNDHNHLRVTRIIKSLGLLAPVHKPLTFYHFIMWKVASYSKPCIVNATSVDQWNKAACSIVYPGSLDAVAVMAEYRSLGAGHGSVGSGLGFNGRESLERARQASIQEKKGSV